MRSNLWPLFLLLAIMAVILAAARGLESGKLARFDSPKICSPSILGGPTRDNLLRLPSAEHVELRVAADRPTHRIIHIADWHFVPREAFAADIQDQSDKALPDEEIDALYAEYLDEVRQAQAAQRQLLRELIKRHGLKQVFCEGLTDSDMPAYRTIIGHVRRRHLDEQDLLKNREPLDETLLRIGAAGQLLAAGEIDEVLPAEDEGAYAQANPLADGDGRITFDGPANDARQSAIVRRMLKCGLLAVIVLGGAHDLSTQVEQLGGGRCEYIKVTPKTWVPDERVPER